MHGKDGNAATTRAMKTVMETLQESFDPIIDLPVKFRVYGLGR
jgi:hypothetical protein